ncbi:MAG: V-type ATP synthase subunit E [Defluviitaleaceae bacterium]|nr:V-type ATP synthase subunit E [Defluviitaleaceae bacterium]
MNAKLEYFAEIISREVETKRRRAKHQAACDLSKKTATEIESAQEKINLRIEKIRGEAVRESNKKISAATAKIKAKYIASQNFLRAELKKNIARDLKIFAQKNEYEIYLIERIIALREGFSTVILRPEDMKFAQTIAQFTGLSVEEGKNFSGGFILQNENKKIFLDYTFETRLEIFAP